MVENKVSEFSQKMNGLLAMEREAEIEETQSVLSNFSFRVSIWLNNYIKVKIKRLCTCRNLKNETKP